MYHAVAGSRRRCDRQITAATSKTPLAAATTTCRVAWLVYRRGAEAVYPPVRGSARHGAWRSCARRGGGVLPHPTEMCHFTPCCTVRLLACIGCVLIFEVFYVVLVLHIGLRDSSWIRRKDHDLFKVSTTSRTVSGKAVSSSSVGVLPQESSWESPSRSRGEAGTAPRARLSGRVTSSPKPQKPRRSSLTQQQWLRTAPPAATPPGLLRMKLANSSTRTI